MKVIAYMDRSTGNMTVIIPVEGDAREHTGMVPDGVDYQILEHTSLPPTREFRDAWRLTVSGAIVDIDAAKEVTKKRLREERAPLLDALDVQMIRAVESGADASAIVAEKQRLRDITKAADDAKSLDELRAISVSKASESDSRR